MVYRCRMSGRYCPSQPPGGGGGLYSWEFLVGVCCPFFRNLTFSNQTSKILAFGQKLCHHYLNWSAKKISSNAFRIRIFLFSPSYWFGIEAINTFIHSRSSLENHTQFQTKMVKICTRFQTKKAPNPYPLGRHIPIWIIWGYTPPPSQSEPERHK